MLFSQVVEISDFIKDTLMQIWKSENFTLKHPLLFEICVCEIYEKIVYKHSETIEYVKN